MILRCVCGSIFLWLALGVTVKAEVTVDSQGYQNVLISFAPNVPNVKGKETVEKIQDLLKSTSSVLHKAIGVRIASATFLLPPSWPTEEWGDIKVTPASSKQTETKPDIRVDATELSPFGKQPVALQHGGCGVPGHQITLPLHFLSSTNGYPKGKLLAREWLKYRYGVFDENGFPGDIFYPDYYRIPGDLFDETSNIRITDCTDSKVTYIFRRPDAGDSRVCRMNSNALGFGFCRAHPDKNSAANVTSSLMYFHEDLTKMEHICGKDGHSHRSTAKNKQNALCNGRSIWDVVKSSPDFRTTLSKPVDSGEESIKFSYIQEPRPRIVVLLEDTDNFLEKERPSAIRFALRRFYYDLPPKSKLAIYTYNSDVREALPFTELPAQERADLGPFADFGAPATSICTSCGLAKAAQILLEDNETEKGSIFLITASPPDKVLELSQKLKGSVACLNVLRFENEDPPANENYDAFARSFDCFSLTIELSTVNIFDALSSFLKNAGSKRNDDFEIKTFASRSLSAKNRVTIPPDPTAELYTLWLGRALESSSIECKAGKNAVELKPHMTATDIASFTFSPADEYVACKLRSSKQQPTLTQVQMMTKKGHNFDFDTWIHDVSTDNEQVPILIYAKLYFGGYPVKNAKATLVVESGKNQEYIVEMLDNGMGDPDVTKYDGIYSAYFSKFLAAGSYQITVRIHDNQGNAKMGKGKPSLTTTTCCGSKVDSEDHDVPAFKMEKIISYQAKTKRPKDGYPPSKILNIFVRVYGKRISLVWTAPGGGGAARYEIRLFLSREDAVSHFEQPYRKLYTGGIVPGPAAGKAVRFDFPNTDLEEDVPYFVAIRSWNEFSKPSEISNVAEFIITDPLKTTTLNETSSTPESTTGGEITNHDQLKSGNNTVGIVLGVIGGIAVFCALAYLGYYFFVRKPRRN